eukprot:Plantae.Rhodophyta-Purpureofilum_apyrenoidigerum.ctg19707.p1 GENE.Plantae.Rhodophyta-Purpureofilum_apyrenoidigerum.ctg19707~~Plantae.Rhodophyta-Purpureofilum_apyrenoidigerum.ctg19707.p1  ORF type:complete len:479 (+),score=72.10 Plantae.Rhodophyta-Purpureofilum_apyrenoidigerum.ctg19707:156-1592(+)
MSRLEKKLSQVVWMSLTGFVGSLGPLTARVDHKTSRRTRNTAVKMCEEKKYDGVPVSEIEKHPFIKMHKEGVLNDHVQKYEEETKVVKGGHHPDEWTSDPLGRSVVNPPVYHNSTVIFKTTESLKYAASDWPFTGMWYGRHGNPTSWALEEAFAVVEGGYSACAVGSGVAAANAALLAFLKSGDHVLMTDAVYDPTRSFCDQFLGRFGITTSYFSPTAPVEDIKSMMQENTKVVFVESPASLSFEIMDIPAVASVAHEAGAVVICDNTWGPLVLKPFELGCDVSINAATKYIGGHSDLMLGLIAAKDEKSYRAVKNSVKELGCPPGPDDCFLALRGLRTLAVRLKEHEKNALEVAKWLEQRPEVVRVMHPALESHPQHELFKRDFHGSTGLFGFQLKEVSDKGVEAMIDGMKIFSIGYSWGGFESIIIRTSINPNRSVKKWEYGDGYGPTIRLSIGFENVKDIIAELEEGFNRLNTTQ